MFRSLAGATGALVAAALVSGSAFAQEVTLRAASFLPLEPLMHAAFERDADAISVPRRREPLA